MSQQQETEVQAVEAKTTTVRDKRTDKGAASTGFQDGKFKPLITLSHHHIPGAWHEFTHDQSSIESFTDGSTNIIWSASSQFFNDAYAQDGIREAMRRMSHLLIAKKLAYSIDDENKALYGEDLKTLRNIAPFAVKPLQRVVEGFGPFKLGDNWYRPQCLPLHAFSHFVKAVGILGQNGLPNDRNRADMFVNVNMADWRRQLVEYYRSQYERWATSTDTVVTIIQGAQQVQVKPPIVVQGWAGLTAWFNALGVVAPVDITEAVAILTRMEAVAGLAIGAADLAELANRRVFLVDWNKQIQTDLYANYIEEYQYNYSALFKTVYDCVESVTSFEQEGQAWQLVDSRLQNNGRYPFEMGEANLEIGYMMARRAYIKFNASQFQVTSEQAAAVAKVMYWDKMKKGQKR